MSCYSYVNMSIIMYLQETPLSPNYMDTAMMRTPGADSRMFQTPGRPNKAAYPGSTQTTKRPGSVTFQFPESTGRAFRQGMGTDVSLSTWGSDFSPTGYSPYGATANSPTPAQVSSGFFSSKINVFYYREGGRFVEIVPNVSRLIRCRT